MTMWTAIVLIVIAAVAGEAWRLHVKARGTDSDRAAVDDLARRLDALESDLRGRVETLERIVTDRTEDLRRRFDDLDRTG